jgi:guanine deaminase
MEREIKYMLEAVELSRKGLSGLEGGPFGCVIVRGDEVVGRGWNKVISSSDPTAHAEIVAIREACEKLGSYQLAGCEVYTSCEPCPMCLGALYWARPDKIYYGNTREDAAGIGFDDSMIYDELNTEISNRRINMINLGNKEAYVIFQEWHASEAKKHY